jgi:glutathione S-transferase
MSLTLYAGSGSPYVWKVWLALEFKGLEYTLKMLSFSAGETRTPEYRAISPRARLA